MLDTLDNIQKNKCSFAKYQNISRYNIITKVISNNNKRIKYIQEKCYYNICMATVDVIISWIMN